MRNAIFSAIYQGMLAVGTLALLGGACNCLFGWNIGLTPKGGQTLELPHDWPSVLLFTAFLYFIAAVSWVIANPSLFMEKVRQNKVAAAVITLGSLAVIAAGVYNLSGGALGRAISNDDGAAVAQAMKSGSLSQEQVRKELHLALKNGKLAAAKAMLENGAEVNAAGGDQNTTVLGEGVVFFPKQAILLLLEQKADPNAKDKFGRNPAVRMILYRLTWNKQENEESLLELLKALQTAGCRLDTPDSEGKSAKDTAKLLGFKKIEKFLEGNSTQ